MTEKPRSKKKKGFNASLVIGILGVAATLIAGLMPVLFDSARAEPTLPPASLQTATSPATETATFTSLPPTFTSTPEPPTSTPTPIIGIYNVSLAMDNAGQFPTALFTPKQYIFVFYSLIDPSGLNQVKIIWYAVDVVDLTPNSIIFVSEKTIAEQTTMIRARFNETWGIGKYRIEFFLNGALDESIGFEVQN